MGRANRSFSTRPQRSSDGGDRTNGFAPRKPYSRDSASRSEGGRTEGRSARPDGPPFRKFDAPRTPRPFRAKPDSDSRPSGGFAEKKPYTKSGSQLRREKTLRQIRRNLRRKILRRQLPQKTGGSFAGKKPFSKSAAGSTGKPASTFDKFKGNKKPFGKRTPTRKFKPEEGE